MCGLCLCDDYSQRHGLYCEECGVRREGEGGRVWGEEGECGVGWKGRGGGREGEDVS